MSSPMSSPHLHDKLVLLGGGKRWEVPGLSRVQVGLAANNDVQALPAEGDAVTQLNEASGTVEVRVEMWTGAQWKEYQQLLAHLRRGAKDGPAVFTSAHPEIAGRKIKRLFFVSEQGDAYQAGGTYKATLKFSEKLKEKSPVAALGSGGIDLPPTPGSGTPSHWGSGVTTASGRAVADAMVRSMQAPPVPVGNRGETTATPGFCSASVRVGVTAAGVPREMFGGTALATEANARRMGLGRSWQPGVVQVGDMVTWANDASGSGHIGVVVGFDKADGMPLLAGNNLVSASKNPRDARGVVRMDQLSSSKSQPTTIIRPGGWGATPAPKPEPMIGPPAPVPVPKGMPSSNVQPPVR